MKKTLTFLVGILTFVLSGNSFAQENGIVYGVTPTIVSGSISSPGNITNSNELAAMVKPELDLNSWQ